MKNNFNGDNKWKMKNKKKEDNTVYEQSLHLQSCYEFLQLSIDLLSLENLILHNCFNATTNVFLKNISKCENHDFTDTFFTTCETVEIDGKSFVFVLI